MAWRFVYQGKMPQGKCINVVQDNLTQKLDWVAWDKQGTAWKGRYGVEEGLGSKTELRVESKEEGVTLLEQKWDKG